jgi:hypothetical protein
MEHCFETEGTDFRIWALSNENAWLPLISIKATPEQFQHYRMPWILSIEDLKQDESVIETQQESI